MARSAAAMMLGYAKFDPTVKIAGVVFNRIKRESHYHILKEAVGGKTNVPVVGYIQPNSELIIPDRHLGLQTALEGKDPMFYVRLGEAVASTLDVEAIALLAEAASDWEDVLVPATRSAVVVAEKPVRVGVAHDPAFCFYYPDNLALLEQAGGRQGAIVDSQSLTLQVGKPWIAIIDQDRGDSKGNIDLMDQICLAAQGEHVDCLALFAL